MPRPEATPCPCGSTLTREACCEPPLPPNPNGPQLPDAELFRFLTRWAIRRFGDAFAPGRDYPGALGCPECDSVLRVPWAVHDYPVHGRTVADWFRRDYGRLLGAPTRAWFDAHAAAWCSVWAVLDTDRGRTLELQDCFTGVRTVARETWHSRWVRPGWYLWLRVIEGREGPEVAAQHPLVASPEAAAAALEAARWALDAPVGRVAAERLRSPEAVATLIRAWEAPLAA